MSQFKIKRIYDEPSKDDGYRVLVDRLWPRGVSKERAQLDEWNKELAPSPELRKWFNHDPEKFNEFSARYKEELAAATAPRTFLAIVKNQPHVTLLYGAKSQTINHAAVLQEFLERTTAQQR